jgi:hypothetical protein
VVTGEVFEYVYDIFNMGDKGPLKLVCKPMSQIVVAVTVFLFLMIKTI